jgi:CCAAT/enhancer binding protein (C/EBP) gamma
VKRSREKAREKANETTSKVTNLKNENEKLEEKVKLLSKELDFLKNIFLAHAGETGSQCNKKFWFNYMKLILNPKKNKTTI